ncbi:MAG: RagB/SusD family nutrient uptake outer membrane protein [Butyricimonas faecihominis]
MQCCFRHDQRGERRKQNEKRVEGEARILRSFHYFNLINLYAYPYNAPNAPQGKAAGIPLKLSSTIDQNSVPRSTVAEVYAAIISDVEKGINLLTEINATGSKFRIGMNAAHLLASRYYLFMENWEKQNTQPAYSLHLEVTLPYMT